MSERALSIAMLTHSINPRGGVVHALQLAEALTARGHDVTLFAPARPGERLFRAAACALELVPVDDTPAASTVQMVETRVAAYVTHLRGALARRGFDVLHAQDSISGNALATLRAAAQIEARQALRTVHHLDSFDDLQLAAYQLRGFAGAGRVLCVSEMWRTQLRATYGIDALPVSNGVDTTRFTPRNDATDAALHARLGRLGRRGAGPVFLAVGGIEARKNSIRLLEAFATVRRQLPQAQLLIAGGASLLDHDAYGKAFRAAAAGFGWLDERDHADQPEQADQADQAARSDNTDQAPSQSQRLDTISQTDPALRILGKIDDRDMPALFRYADVVAMPSLREGFGLVALEALASGTPAVVSNIAPFTEHLDERDVSFADPYDSASIARALLAALGRTVDARALCARFSWAASAAQHEAIYRQTVLNPLEIH